MTGDPLDRITNGVQVALRESRDSGGSTPEFVPTPPSVSCADVLALVEIARAARAVTEHHFDTCDLVLGLSPAYPCSCGIDALRLALARLDDDQ